MEKISLSFTVFFEDPFWVGLFEERENNKLSVCKVTFGKEVNTEEVYEFLSRKNAFDFSPSVIVKEKSTKNIGFKKMMKLAKKSVTTVSMGTKSQQALKLLQEQNKLERKVISKEEKEQEAEKLFLLKKQKRKEKHKGR